MVFGALMFLLVSLSAGAGHAPGTMSESDGCGGDLGSLCSVITLLAEVRRAGPNRRRRAACDDPRIQLVARFGCSRARVACVGADGWSAIDRSPDRLFLLPRS